MNATPVDNGGAPQQTRPIHAKANRSLQLWKSDEMIGEALAAAFLSDSTTAELSYELLLQHKDAVVRLVHEVSTAQITQASVVHVSQTTNAVY